MPSALAAASLGGLRLPRAWVLPVGAAVLTIAWAPRSWQRAEAWRDDGAIAEAELAVVPDNPLALQIVGRRRVALGDVGGFEMWEAAIARAPGNTFLLDPQRQRLDLATAAWQLGDAPRARRVLADFVRGEAEAGREVAPDVRHLQAAVEAAPAPGLPARPEHSEPP